MWFVKPTKEICLLLNFIGNIFITLLFFLAYTGKSVHVGLGICVSFCYTYRSMEAQGQCQASSVSQCIEAGFLANLKLPSSTGPCSQPALSSPVSLAPVLEWRAGTCVHSAFPRVWGILNVIFMLAVKLFIPWAILSSMTFFCTSSNMNERVAFVDTGIGVSQPC